MFNLSNSFLYITGISSIVMLSLIPQIYKNRYNILLSILSKLIDIKNKLGFNKKTKNKNEKDSFFIKDILITGKFIDYYKKINDNNIEVICNSVNPLIYYKDVVTFMLSYEINKQSYCFVRKNYIENCLSDFSEFIKDINQNYDKYEDLSSNILNSELILDNGEVIDITNIMKMMEGFKKDYNCNCIYIKDIINYLNYQIIDKDIENKFLRIHLIDFLANEHKFHKDDKFILKDIE